MNDTEDMPSIFNSNSTILHIDEAADVFNKYFLTLIVRLYRHLFCCVIPKRPLLL